MSDSDSEASDDTDTIFNDYVTLGKASDFETVIWRFPDTEDCPLKNCMLSCGSRMTCLQHFQMHHAGICMICTVCDELFLVQNPIHLLRHYQVQHPNERSPKLKETEDIPPKNVCEILKKSHSVGHKKKSQEITHDLNYKITMSGCGQLTSWIFPDTTKCPNRTCQRVFKNRADTMKHFRDEHAKDSILCKICQKPISTKSSREFVRHYNRVHPNEKVPYNFAASESPRRSKQAPQKTRLIREPKVEIVSNDEDDDEDFITLQTCGITTKWRYPENVRECVVLNCHEKFRSKSDAMAHFRQNHAIGSILCSICDRPIRSSKGLNDFRKHYAYKHPNHSMPFDYEPVGSDTTRTNTKKGNVQVKQEQSHNDDDLVQLKYGEWRFPDTSACPVRGCGIQFDRHLDALIHYKQQHAHTAALCQLCDKPIRVDALTQHFRSVHSNQEIPYGFGDSASQSTDQKFRAKWVDKSEEYHDENAWEEADDMIVLSACGLQFKWQFPKGTRCPVKPCSANFGSRSDAIDHFKKIHAYRSTLCPVCKTPVLMRKFSDISYHFKQRHPHADIPPYFEKLSVKWNKDNEQPKSEAKSYSANGNQPSNQANADIQSRDDNAADDDIITLSAFGVITQYQFPKNLKQCPVANCRRDFQKRSDCIAHYKKMHAKGSVLCPICVRPIRVADQAIGLQNFKGHYQRMHPTEKIPYNFKTGKATASEQAMDQSDANENDVITLTSHARKTYWRFPMENWQVCPAIRCHLKFETRSDAIEHFKLEHSENSICCPICDRPICAFHLGNFRKHYSRIHPNVKFPIDIGLGTNKSPLYQIKEEIDEENNDEEDEEDDEVNGHEEEDLIELTTCGITTQWLFPDKCRVCPVGNCRQHFRTRLDGIKHFRESHTIGSICCPVCDEPVRSSHSLNDFRKHFQKRHPHDKMPFEAGTKGFFPKQKQQHLTPKSDDDDDDENSDVIILRGLGQRMKWIFPASLTQCPVVRCTAVSSGNRAALKAHYRKVHADASVLCELCNKPIATRNGKHNVIIHYRHKHPNAAIPDFDSVNSECTMEMKPKVELDSRVACDLCNARIEPDDMDAHLNEMHSTHRIFCPLKLCSYVAKRMTEMRTHWNHEHKGMAFPEFRDETDFSYVIDTSNHINGHGDERKHSQTRMDLAQSTRNKLSNGEGSSKSTAQQHQVMIDSSDSESSDVEEIPPLQVPHSSKRKKSSDSSAWFTGIESNDNYAADERIAKRHKEFASYSKANVKRRISSSSSSSSCSSSTLSSTNDMSTSRNMARKRMYQPGDDNIHESKLPKPTTANEPMKIRTLECSVVLERISCTPASNLNTVTSTSTETLNQSESSSSMSSNHVFYVADSDEEEATKSSNDLTNANALTSKPIHLRRMSVLMMAPNASD